MWVVSSCCHHVVVNMVEMDPLTGTQTTDPCARNLRRKLKKTQQQTPAPSAARELEARHLSTFKVPVLDFTRGERFCLHTQPDTATRDMPSIFLCFKVGMSKCRILAPGAFKRRRAVGEIPPPSTVPKDSHPHALANGTDASSLLSHANAPNGKSASATTLMVATTQRTGPKPNPPSGKVVNPHQRRVCRASRGATTSTANTRNVRDVRGSIGHTLAVQLHEVRRLSVYPPTPRTSPCTKTLHVTLCVAGRPTRFWRNPHLL